MTHSPIWQESVRLIEQARSFGRGVVYVKPRPVAPSDMSQLAALIDLPVINLSLELARELLDTPARRRPFRAPAAISNILDRRSGDLVVARLGLLHLPELKLDPVRALEHHARTRVIVAEWLGDAADDALTYGEPGHNEYGHWDRPVGTFISLG